MTLTCGEVIINHGGRVCPTNDRDPGYPPGSFCVWGLVMVRRGNPAQREWVGNNRTDIQKQVYASSDVCWLDGKPIAWDAPPRSRWAPSVDHVVPRSRGGDPFDLANCRLAHYGCNARRGNRAPRPYVSQVAEFVTRRW